MRILYIGHYDQGSTSRMRGECLRDLLHPDQFVIANIDVPLKATNRVLRSIGWRLKIGPLIKKINAYLLSVINGNWEYDLIWVDKGVFINPKIIKRLSENSTHIIHYTPDAAFISNRSKLFFKAIRYYSTCVTTKSFESSLYKKNGATNLFLCTQGYQPQIHMPYFKFEEKSGIVFIGLHETDREITLTHLLKKGFKLTLAGKGWKKFVQKNRSMSNFFYLGESLFDEEYAKAISSGLISIGFLSRKIPELHTTRTIEIPACGTALFTERNDETQKIFDETEAIFYNNTEELIDKIEYAFSHTEWVRKISANGHIKITKGGYDYKSILKNVITTKTKIKN